MAEPQPQPQGQGHGQGQQRPTVDDAVRRVNKLKEIIIGLIGENKNNDDLIKKKLQSIKDKIQKLKEIKDKMNTKMNLLTTSYDKAIDLMKTTDDIEQLYEPMNKLKEQIYETIAFNEDDLDSVIRDLDSLVRENQQPPQQQPQQQQGGKRKQRKQIKKGKSRNHKNKLTKKHNRKIKSNKSRKYIY
jgi:hypothetical protein